MDKTIYWIQHTKKNGSRKNGDKDRKALHKLMNNAVYRKAFENSRNKTSKQTKKKTIYNVHQNEAICCTKYLTLI